MLAQEVAPIGVEASSILRRRGGTSAFRPRRGEIAHRSTFLKPSNTPTGNGTTRHTFPANQETCSVNTLRPALLAGGPGLQTETETSPLGPQDTIVGTT